MVAVGAYDIQRVGIQDGPRSKLCAQYQGGFACPFGNWWAGQVAAHVIAHDGDTPCALPCSSPEHLCFS